MSNRIGFIQGVRDELLSYLKSERDAREFVMDELNAGSLGSVVSRSFAQGSGIDVNALESLNRDVGVAQQYLSTVCTHNIRIGLPREEVLMCRLAVLDLIMQQYQFGKYGRGKYNIIERIVLEKQRYKELEIDVYENFIVHKLKNRENQTYIDNYFKHTTEKGSYFISPIYGYITIQNDRVIEDPYDGEREIFQIIERVVT